MKKILFLFLFFLFVQSAFSNGVGVVNAASGIYLKLTGTKIDVSVEMQISITKSTQLFLNNLGSDKTVSFAFPLPDGASATNLRWKINGIWQQAPISPTP